MDKTLDEIINARAKGGRRTSSRRGSAKSQVLGSSNSPAARARAAPAATNTKGAGTPLPSEKIMVSNLPLDVNEPQIRELFTTTVGPLRDVTLLLDAKGNSKGVASVEFSRKGDGTRAYQQYHNRLVDGKRPMKIEIIVDPSRPASLVSRVAPLPPAAVAIEGAARTGGRPRRGRGGGAGGRKRSERPAKTAADLDAEMEDYTATSAPVAAA
ncbi:hypothetical protein BC835DRAFT_1324750 [Cytidiella melzeri]|nr:hypothetical protein BC835DRAFT_1324750 [Cytidiella melzeri]